MPVWNLSSGEQLHIPTNNLVDATYKGSKIEQEVATEFSGYTKFIGTSKRGGGDVIDEAIIDGMVVKVHIPVDGMQIYYRVLSSPTDIIFSPVKELVNAANLKESPGKWE